MVTEVVTVVDGVVVIVLRPVLDTDDVTVTLNVEVALEETVVL